MELRKGGRVDFYERGVVYWERRWSLMRVVALEPQELLALLRAAKAHSARAHAMTLLAVRHGMRASEVCGLPLEHLSLREESIRVVRLKGSLTTVQSLKRHPGQPLLDEVRVLGAWMRVRPDDGSGFVFTSTHGGRMHRVTFFRLWRKLAEQAGLPPEKHHPHVAKHSLGTFLARQNVGAFAIKQALGHRSISSTAVYTSVTDAEADRAAAAVFMVTF
jgi:integrase